MDEMKKILVLNIGGLGDMVLATPALEALAAQVDGGKLDILTVKRALPVVEKAPFVRRVYTVDVSVLTGRTSIGGAARFAASLATLFRLRMARYELAVDLMATESREAGVRRRILFTMIAAGRTAGRNTDGWADWHDVRADETLSSPIHEIKRKLSVIEALGLSIESGPMRVYSTDEDEKKAETIVGPIGPKGGFAILVPGAWRPTRRWNPAGFCAVGNHIRRRWGLEVAVCGSSDEKEVVKEVADGIAGAFVLLDVPPRVLFEIFNRCAIIVTNDTGPMHLAAAGRPMIVAIFGHEPDRYAPEEPGRIEVLYQRVYCSPCTRYSCPDMSCLQGIGVDMVTGAVDLLMDREKRTSS